MASAPKSVAQRSLSASRTSLACIPCRQRHVKCDAKRPACDRCFTANKACHYLDSRRGGLTRSALAERRRYLQERQRSAQSEDIVQPAPSTNGSTPQHAEVGTQPISDDGYVSWPGTATSSTVLDGGPAGMLDLFDQDWNVFGDHRIDLYYKHFHRLHPCVLPRKHLERLLEDESNRSHLKTLLLVMRSIGSLYAPSSRYHPQKIASRISPGTDPLQDAFSAQCLLLNSIALYWCGDEDSSREEMDRAIHIALSISMHTHAFAITYGMNNTVLQESWRRTWWQICVVDAYYAAMMHKTSALMCKSDITAELPCEEAEYETGIIPVPRTMDEFHSRDLAVETHVFSSFAYLIGALQAVSYAMESAFADDTSSNRIHPCESLAVATEGWSLLLPESKKAIHSTTGEIDELMFQAQMTIHATAVALYRRYSGLLFDPSEVFSSCPTSSYDNIFHASPASGTIYTTWCIRAASAQIRLLAQPTPPYSHTPFTVCMLVNATICLISACKHELLGPSLRMTREQIRMSIGCLRSFATVWPRADRSLQEVRAIAQQMLLHAVSHDNASLSGQGQVIANT